MPRKYIFIIQWLKTNPWKSGNDKLSGGNPLSGKDEGDGTFGESGRTLNLRQDDTGLFLGISQSDRYFAL